MNDSCIYQIQGPVAAIRVYNSPLTYSAVSSAIFTAEQGNTFVALLSNAR